MKKTPLEYSLYLLQLRDRTEAEIRKKMKDKGFLAEDIEKTIIWLKEKEFVDDERFAQRLIEDQRSKIESGKRKIILKMYKLGLNKELIDRYSGKVEEESELEKAEELAERWLTKNAEKDKKYERLGRHLAGKGYEIDTIKEVLGKVIK